jgi:DHA2 family multidrug resistance protein
VEPRETASAAGVMSFMRTMAGAIGASIATTYWDDSQRVARSEIVGRLNTTQTADRLSSQGFSLDQTRQVIANIVDRESLAQATNHVFLVLAVLFVVSAMVIWLTPKPGREVDSSAAH